MDTEPREKLRRLSDRSATSLSFLKRQPGGTWELIVPSPEVGSSYGLEWCLPNLAYDRSAANFAKKIRLNFINLVQGKKTAGGTREKFHEVFVAFAKTIFKKYGTVEAKSGKIFDVSFATYDDKYRGMRIVDTTNNGVALELKDPRFFAPYGLSIAGSCFRDAGKAMFYVREEDEIPSVYLPSQVLHRNHEMLLAIPFALGIGTKSAKSSAKGKRTDPWEKSRYCIGVISIGTTSSETKLKKTKDLDWISRKSQLFIIEALSILMSRMVGSTKQ